MILFFRTPTNSVIATEVSQELASEDIRRNYAGYTVTLL